MAAYWVKLMKSPDHLEHRNVCFRDWAAIRTAAAPRGGFEPILPECCKSSRGLLSLDGVNKLQRKLRLELGLVRNDWFDVGYRLTDDPSYKVLCEIQTWLKDGDLEQLEYASQVVDSFPYDSDNCYRVPWIVHAVSSGSLKSVQWMIKKDVNLQTTGADGYPPLISCIEVEGKEKYQIMRLLIDSGADVNERGINGWTPLHIAAVRDDEVSMRILLEAGADRTITTQIDDDATAEEEARNLGHQKSADFIASFSS